MHHYIYILIIAIYFSILLGISWLTSRKADNRTFFTANRKAPWFLVAFGMVGAALSGVTFISIPGAVGKTQFSYLQMVMGSVLGYLVIAFVLLPLYYRLKLVSIYGYLQYRFGFLTQKTGALLFIVSQMMGASLRLFLAASVLQFAIFDDLHVPFYASVMVTIFLIWIYTFKSGIKTIIWTDTLQTLTILLSLVLTIFIIKSQLNFDFSELYQTLQVSSYTEIFRWNWHDPHFFVKDFLAGAFIIIAMAGLDQNMMQKNLTCSNIGDAQKNVIAMTIIYLTASILFVLLGALLYIYMHKMSMAIPEKSDEVFPLIALHYLGAVAGIIFFIGAVAAAFSSADSALAALTTSFCYDLANIKDKTPQAQKQLRILSHFSFSIMMFLVIISFYYLSNQSVISAVFTVAGYTYGPLLGMFAFGIFSKRDVRPICIPILAILAPILTYIISVNADRLFWGYQFGFEVLLLNAFLMMLGMWLFSQSVQLMGEVSDKKRKEFD